MSVLSLGEAAGDEAPPWCKHFTILPWTCGLSRGGSYSCFVFHPFFKLHREIHRFASFLEKMRLRSWRMAKGLFSSRLSNTAVQSSPCPPLSRCLALLPVWGLWHMTCLCSLLKCTLITVLQAGVSHTANAASWEMQTTHWLTLLYSKTPGKLHMDVEKEYWFVRYTTESESRQSVFSRLSSWEPVCLPQTWTEPKHKVTEQFEYWPAFVLLSCFAIPRWS